MMASSTFWKNKQSRYAWAMSAPAIVCLLLFVILPLVLAGFLSLTDKRLITPLPTQFIGLSNYQNLLGIGTLLQTPEVDPSTGQAQRDEQGNPVYPRLRTILRGNPAYEGFQEWFTVTILGNRLTIIAKDPTFMQSLVNTSVFALIIVPFQGGLALLLALLVNQKLRVINLFRTIYFSPVVTSMAVLSVVWTFLYNPDQGLINRFLDVVTLGQIKNIPWLVGSNTALLAIIILSAWQGAGFQMVIFLAGLQGIAEEFYEAAQIDGANDWQQFRFITLPQLRNTIIFVIVGTTILAFRLFTQVDVMTKGGPNNATISVVYDAIDQGFTQQKLGYASAITVVFFVIVLVIAGLQRFVLRSEKEIE